MTRSLQWLAALLLVAAPLRAGELDSEFGPTPTPTRNEPATSPTAAPGATLALNHTATALAAPTSELDSEKPAQAWHHWGGGWGWHRGLGWGGWGGGWGWGRGFGLGLGLGYGLGYGGLGYGLGYGGLGYGGLGWGGGYRPWGYGYGYGRPYMGYAMYRPWGLGCWW